MTLMEIINYLVIATSVVALIIVLLFIISRSVNSKRKAVDLREEKPYGNALNETSVSINNLKYEYRMNNSFFETYRNTICNYPRFINFIKQKEFYPINYDKREIYYRFHS